MLIKDTFIWLKYSKNFIIVKYNYKYIYIVCTYIYIYIYLNGEEGGGI